MSETVKTIDLTTGYFSKKGHTAVTSNINASLHSGELTCLLGPNGAGKSTLLKTLSAFIPPLKGEIRIMGKNLREYTDAGLAKVIGVVLTERLGLANMSVEELVGLGRAPYTGFFGNLSKSDREIVDEAISLVKIGDLRGRMVQTLSDGERQKAMIAKALAQQTPVIFLDEPTAFLDYPSKVEIMQLLLRLSSVKDKTIFLSTHDMELALQIADTVWLIDKPNGVTVGSPEDVALDGSLEKYFLRDGICFEPETGLFKIDHKIHSKVNVRGSGIPAAMARKALLRNGIGTDAAENTDITVEADDSGFSIYDNITGKPIADRLLSITQLLDKLSQSNSKTASTNS